MRLLYDPLSVFKSSRTPAGLYARQKWLGEVNSSDWRSDFQHTVTELLAEQSTEGSWDNSVVSTIKHLFGLHLTVRNCNEPVKRSLEWLLNLSETAFPGRRIEFEKGLESEDLSGLPFSKGCRAFFLYGATLFLSSIFGMQQDTLVLKFYEWLDTLGIQNDGRWCGWSCSNNILRAFVVHPEYSKRNSTILAAKALSRVQNSNGIWVRHVPFYQTVNALAHLSSPESEPQLESAFKQLYKTQNRDGTWGRNDCEWNTFLVVHALKNKGEL